MGEGITFGLLRVEFEMEAVALEACCAAAASEAAAPPRARPTQVLDHAVVRVDGAEACLCVGGAEGRPRYLTPPPLLSAFRVFVLPGPHLLAICAQGSCTGDIEWYIEQSRTALGETASGTRFDVVKTSTSEYYDNKP